MPQTKVNSRIPNAFKAEIPTEIFPSGLDGLRRQELVDILQLRYEFISNVCFRRPSEVQLMLSDESGVDKLLQSEKFMRVRNGWDEYFRYRGMSDAHPPRLTSDRILLTKEQETVLFLRYNFFRREIVRAKKHSIGGRLEKVPSSKKDQLLTNIERLVPTKTRNPKPISLEVANSILYWNEEANKTKDTLFYANLGLVLSQHKRWRVNIDFHEAAQEGSMALMRSIEKFDVAKENKFSKTSKFSTYACRAIQKSFFRIVETSIKRYNIDGTSVSAIDTEGDRPIEAICNKDIVDQLEDSRLDERLELLREVIGGEMNPAELTDQERMFLRLRFRLNEPGVKEMPLNEVGKRVGYTRERVRQVVTEALGKLRIFVENSQDFQPR